MNDISKKFNEAFKIDAFFVGFEPIVKKLAENAEQAVKFASKYPPYNIMKIDENKYTIEMAVAGFSKQDIEVELAGSNLIIKGNVKQGQLAEKDTKGEWTWPAFIHQGLAMRPFTRQFTLADNVEIKNAELMNGILKVVLEAIIPEEKKPVKIEIKEKV